MLRKLKSYWLKMILFSLAEWQLPKFITSQTPKMLILCHENTMIPT